ncbi:MAG: hypothetical protein ACTSWW_07935 [Promethearchaeota archaeon]
MKIVKINKKSVLSALCLGMMCITSTFLVLTITSSGTLPQTGVKITRIQIVDELIQDDYYIEFAAVPSDSSYSWGSDPFWNIADLEYQPFYSNSYWLEGWDDTLVEFHGADCIVGLSNDVNLSTTSCLYFISMKVTRNDFWHDTASHGFLVEIASPNTEYTFICHFPEFGGDIQVWFEVQNV